MRAVLMTAPTPVITPQPIRLICGAGPEASAEAEPLAAIAELIESTARFCVESRRFPDELIRDVVELRRTFDRTVELFDKATNPLRSRSRPAQGFGRRVANQDFGRI